MTTATLDGEEDPERLTITVLSDLVDVAADVAGDDQSVPGDVPQGGSNGSQVITRETVKEVPDGPTPGSRFVEAPPTTRHSAHGPIFPARCDKGRSSSESGSGR